LSAHCWCEAKMQGGQENNRECRSYNRSLHEGPPAVLQRVWSSSVERKDLHLEGTPSISGKSSFFSLLAITC